MKFLAAAWRADTLAQQVQLSLAALQQALATIQFLDAPADGVAQTLDFLSKARRLEIFADACGCRRPNSPHPVRSRNRSWPPGPDRRSHESRSPYPCTR